MRLALHLLLRLLMSYVFFSTTPATEIYTLSLHDALPISVNVAATRQAVRSPSAAIAPSRRAGLTDGGRSPPAPAQTARGDRKSTRLNSSHVEISYAVFCLKKKTHGPNCDLLVDNTATSRR